MKRFAIFAICLFAAGAVYAGAEGKFDRYSEFVPALFKKGLYIGPDIGANKVQASTTNKLTAFRLGIATWDFPLLGGASTTDLCAESATLTMTGLKYGDFCKATTDLGQDGGAVNPLDVDLSCRAVTNGVVFKACSRIGDAGTPGGINLPDAGYFGWTFSTSPQ